MNKHFHINKNNSRKSSGIVILFTTIIVLLSFIIVWVLIGEFDVLNLKWFITPLQQNVDGEIVQREIVFNLNILYILIGLILFWTLLFLVLKFAFKCVNWDILPFVIMSMFMGLSLIFTGFIPFTKENSNYIIIARFVILIIVALVSFFLSNVIVTKKIIDSDDGAYIYEEIKKEYEQIEKNKKEQDAFLNKKKKDETYIEIVEE